MSKQQAKQRIEGATGEGAREQLLQIAHDLRADEDTDVTVIINDEADHAPSPGSMRPAFAQTDRLPSEGSDRMKVMELMEERHPTMTTPSGFESAGVVSDASDASGLLGRMWAESELVERTRVYTGNSPPPYAYRLTEAGRGAMAQR